jgi:hypothetical protein
MSIIRGKPCGYSLVSLVIAAILFFSSIAIGSFNPSAANLPGAPLNGSPFAEISTDNLTSMESLVYPSDYEVISERPYIIRVDFTNDYRVSEIQAELAAQQFIAKVFSNQSIQNLEIVRQTTKLFGDLPRWLISFRNKSISEAIHIEAMVTVNAITGGIIGYIGSPIMCQGVAVNQSIAVNCAITALKELGYYIPVNLRWVYWNHWVDSTNEDDITYRFGFQQVVNNTMIDTGIGSIYIEIDGITGGVHYLSYKWIQIDKIPIRGVVSPNGLGYDPVLTLDRVSHDPEDYNEIGPQEFRLCWIAVNPRNELTAFDAFTGDVVYVEDYLGTFHSQNEVRMSFLMPLLISIIPATALYLGTRKILRRQMQ